MPRGPRIGTSASRPVNRALIAAAPHPYKSEKTLTRELDFEEFSECPLIYHNANLIREQFLTKNITKRTIKSLRKIRDFIIFYQNKTSKTTTTPKDVTLEFCVEFILYCIDQGKSSGAQEIRFCWRFLRAVGVPTDLIPPNPVTEPPPKLREELNETSARNFLNAAKRDAKVVIDRYHQAESMELQGRDPRRTAGAKHGSWGQLENRLWICREVLGLRVRSESDLITLGHRGIIRSMEDRPGAVVIDPRLGPTQQTGLLAHLRFFHPNIADLAPFIGLLMIRSNVNLQCVADCPSSSSKWAEPYNSSFSPDGEKERWVTIILPKLRGAQGYIGKRKRVDGMRMGRVAKSPTKISFPSLKQPWSHPFQVLTFVEKLTRPLRVEVRHRIEEIADKSSITDAEKQELARLESIKDDMFLYRNRNLITSLKLATREFQLTPPALAEVFERYGLTDGVRQLRDAGLHFGFRTSGHSLLILHMLARHSSRGTAAAYARRQDFVRRSEELFVTIFDKSVALVRSSNYSLANLKEELRASGLEDWQITNVLDPGNRSRYGNRCGSPTSPPAPFDDGTPPGQLCRGQDCIDGCPLARFLPDALPYLVRQWNVTMQHLASVGIAAAFENSVKDRLQKLDLILSKYPATSVLSEKRKFVEAGEAYR